MANRAFNEEQLEKVLDIIIQELQKQKLLPPDLKKQQLIDQILNRLLDPKDTLSLTMQDLKEPDVKQMLILTILGKAAQHPELKKLDFAALLDPNLRKEDVKPLLENSLKALFSKLNQLKPQGKKQLTEKELDTLVQHILSRIEQSVEARQNKAPSLGVTDIMADALCSLYGINPNFPGMLPVLVQYVTGNQMGIPDPSNANDENSNAFIDVQNRFDAKADPTGAKHSAIATFLESLGVDIDASLDQEAGLHPSKLPHPHPPGTPLT